MRRTAYLFLCLLIVVLTGGLATSKWIASSLPVFRDWSGGHMTVSGPSAVGGVGELTVTPQETPCRNSLIIPVYISYHVDDARAAGIFYGYTADDLTAAMLNVDNTWSIAPLTLLRYARASQFDLRDLGVRILLAYPFLRTTSMAHGLYVDSHYCQTHS